MTGCLWACATAVLCRGGGGSSQRGLFRSKPRTPPEVVRHVRELLVYVKDHREGCGGGKRDSKRDHKSFEPTLVIDPKLKSIKEMKCILYGNGEADPIEEACVQLTKEFFKKTNTFNLLIACLPCLDLETQKDVTQVIANLQRQKVDSRLIALRLHRSKLRSIGYSDGKFFMEFNSKLLSSSNYIIRRQAIQLLGEILLEKSSAEVMVRYVSTKEYLMILTNLLKEESKAVQVEAFHFFKLFVANEKKPNEIVSILRANRKKLLRFLETSI